MPRFRVLDNTPADGSRHRRSRRSGDLILLDVNLPDISGTEVYRRLRQNPVTAEIPVIQITGAWMSEEARQKGMDSGANAYLTEPVDEVTLLREVVNHLEPQPLRD